MSRLLVLRPQPGADATAARIRAMGLMPVVAPIMTAAPLSWQPPAPDAFDGLMLTSAQAVRLGGDAVSHYRNLPVYAVGSATAAAARAAGFGTIIEGETDGVALLLLAERDGRRSLLHLAGEDHMGLSHPAISIERRFVYRVDVADSIPAAGVAALLDGAIALLHSPRAARIFAALLGGSGVPREAVRLACLSAAVAAAAGPGWGAVAHAPLPNDTALLAVAARLCNQGPTPPADASDEEPA